MAIASGERITTFHPYSGISGSNQAGFHQNEKAKAGTGIRRHCPYTIFSTAAMHCTGAGAMTIYTSGGSRSAPTCPSRWAKRFFEFSLGVLINSLHRNRVIRCGGMTALAASSHSPAQHRAQGAGWWAAVGYALRSVLSYQACTAAGFVSGRGRVEACGGGAFRGGRGAVGMMVVLLALRCRDWVLDFHDGWRPVGPRLIGQQRF